MYNPSVCVCTTPVLYVPRVRVRAYARRRACISYRRFIDTAFAIIAIIIVLTTRVSGRDLRLARNVVLIRRSEQNCGEDARWRKNKKKEKEKGNE